MSGVVGTDPGNSGALALLSDAGSLLELADIPCVADGTKGMIERRPAHQSGAKLAF
jgi:hypothetical protein